MWGRQTTLFVQVSIECVLIVPDAGSKVEAPYVEPLELGDGQREVCCRFLYIQESWIGDHR